MKRCSRCGIEQSFDDFHRSRRSPDGHYAYCKTCSREKALAWRQANLEQARANSRSWARRNMERKVEYQREYYAKNPEKYVEYTRRHRERHPEAYETKQRRGRLRREFGLTLEDYDAMVAAQDGVCFLCKRPPSGRLKRLCVDHDHATGKVRKLLCDRCNRTLGFFDEDATLFDRAAEYLRRTW